MESEDKNGFSNSKFVMVCVVCGKIEFRAQGVEAIDKIAFFILLWVI
jgi:hypothetical protein